MRWLLLAVLVPMVSGCISNVPVQPEPFDVPVAFVWGDGANNAHMVVRVDPATAPAAGEYVGTSLSHPGHFTLHDLLESVAAQHGASIGYELVDGRGFVLRSYETHATWSNETGGQHWSGERGGRPVPALLHETHIDSVDPIVFRLMTVVS